MNTLDLQLVEKRAEHFQEKGDNTSLRWFYMHDVPELLKEIARLQDALYRELWKT
jgi:hypothetical protein